MKTDLFNQSKEELINTIKYMWCLCELNGDESCKAINEFYGFTTQSFEKQPIVKVTVTKRTNGRNTHFKDTGTGKTMTRTEFVKEIRKGNYSNYSIRKIYGKDTPVSKHGQGSKNCLKNNYCRKEI